MSKYSIGSTRITVGGEKMLTIGNSDDQTIALVLYGDGSTEQHVAAYKEANAMVWGLNNYKPVLIKTEKSG